MSDVHALSGAYALDALDDSERAEFERHLAVCSSCRLEVAGLVEAAGSLADLSDTLGDGFGDAFLPALWSAVQDDGKPFGPWPDALVWL